MAAEQDGVLDLAAHDLPRVAEPQPLVGDLVLKAVADLLIEDPELVADAVADGRDAQRRERVHVAGGETPETSVAEAGLLLPFDERLEIEPELSHCGARVVLQAEVEEVVAELGPDQELGRQVRHGAALMREVGVRGVKPALQHSVANRVREREVVIVGRGDRIELGQARVEVGQEITDDGRRAPPEMRGLRVEWSVGWTVRVAHADSSAAISTQPKGQELRQDDAQ